MELDSLDIESKIRSFESCYRKLFGMENADQNNFIKIYVTVAYKVGVGWPDAGRKLKVPVKADVTFSFEIRGNTICKIYANILRTIATPVSRVEGLENQDVERFMVECNDVSRIPPAGDLECLNFSTNDYQMKGMRRLKYLGIRYCGTFLRVFNSKSESWEVYPSFAFRWGEGKPEGPFNAIKREGDMISIIPEIEPFPFSFEEFVRRTNQRKLDIIRENS